MKKLLCLAMALMLTVTTLVSCNKEGDSERHKVDAPDTQATFDVTSKENVKVRITLTDDRVMEFVLYPDKAPITVQNFVDLATSGFYDGLIFHRIVEDFVVQGGDPAGDGTGGSEKTIKGEFSENGVANDISHKKGVISMARQSSLTSSSSSTETDTKMDSATSQFFICTKDASASLDGKYAAFGEMTKGWDVLSSLNKVSVDEDDKPVKDIVIESIRVID